MWFELVVEWLKVKLVLIRILVFLAFFTEIKRISGYCFDTKPSPRGLQFFMLVLCMGGSVLLNDVIVIAKNTL